MKITLKKKQVAGDRQPLVVVVEDPRDYDKEPAQKKYPKIVRSVSLGEVLDVATLCPGANDEDVHSLAHKILSQYKGCFVMGEDKSVAKSYKDKSLAAEAGV